MEYVEEIEEDEEDFAASNAAQKTSKNEIKTKETVGDVDVSAKEKERGF